MQLYIYEYGTDEFDMDYNFILANSELEAKKQTIEELEFMGLDKTNINRIYSPTDNLGYKIIKK